MKREFFQELKVNGESLPKTVIDAIMAENGRDIENAKASVDVQALQMEAQQWKDKFTEAEKTHAQQLDAMVMDREIREAVTAARGRNLKAITALLDLDTLRTAENRAQAVQEAVEAVRQEADYLFSQPTPPPYAGGTGTAGYTNQTAPTTLAGALKEKFERK